MNDRNILFFKNAAKRKTKILIVFLQVGKITLKGDFL